MGSSFLNVFSLSRIQLHKIIVPFICISTLSSFNLLHRKVSALKYSQNCSFSQNCTNMNVDPDFPGTAVQRMFAIRERVRSLTIAELSEDWESVRRRLLWAGGLRDLPDAMPGMGYTGNGLCFDV
jgi:hypothetical protein